MFINQERKLEVRIKYIFIKYSGGGDLLYLLLWMWINDLDNVSVGAALATSNDENARENEYEKDW